MSGSPENEKTAEMIGFLDLATFDDGGAFRGGCLVTDPQTRPLEFRVSGAVQPTNLQKMLYGETLHEYITNDLIGLPMLQTLENQPEMLLVRDAEFLKLRPRLKMPVLWVRGTVDGQFALQAYPGHEAEAEGGREMLPRRLRGRNIMEPFLRIRTAIEEAHRLKVGDPRKE
jgi:hypothetical protein